MFPCLPQSSLCWKFHFTMGALSQTHGHQNTTCFGDDFDLFLLDLFLLQEMSLHSVEFLKVQTTKGLSGKYLEHKSYLCARHGQPVDYIKKNPLWGRKVPLKVMDCTASLTIKSYVGTPYILGIYDLEHNHPLGNENLRFTHISPLTQDWIAGMVQMKVKTDHIVRILALLAPLLV